MPSPALRGIGGALLGVAVLLGPLPARSEGAIHRVTIERFRFVPAELTIHPGDVVEWTNVDAVPHNAAAHDGAWNTGKIVNGESARMSFSIGGAFDYLCTYHPHMRARVTVSAD